MTDKSQISPERAIAFLNECASYFDMEPTRNEDSQHWASVANAETCRRIAKMIASPSPPPSAGVGLTEIDEIEAAVGSTGLIVKGDGSHTVVPIAVVSRLLEMARASVALPQPSAGVDAVAERAQAAWDAISDGPNQWHCLSLDEQDTFVEFATALSALTPAPTPVEAGGEIERLKVDVERLTRERDQARADYEQEADWSKTVDRHGLDSFDDLAERWLKIDAIQRMHNAAASVFAKWANDELMGRFKGHMTRIMHTAFVEGAIAGVRVATAKPASEPAGGDVQAVRWHEIGKQLSETNEWLFAEVDRLKAELRAALSAPASSSPAEEA